MEVDREFPEYSAALEVLSGLADYEKTGKWAYDDVHFDLARMEGLLSGIGNPHKFGRFVHIAGTNGKGSVASMIASALSRSGMRTGLYTSPHLVSVRERIRIDSEMIPRSSVIENVNILRPLLDKTKGLTFFEAWTALAFLYFASMKTDISVLEVGMGGRLDSTNVIRPEVSVITPVSEDHIRTLGPTIEKIAAEKAGIIKRGVPVVSSPQRPEVLNVIESKTAEMSSNLILVGRDTRYRETKNGIEYHGAKWNMKAEIPLYGEMQKMNAATTLAALEILSADNCRITEADAAGGIKGVIWPGRLQKIDDRPEVFLDGACNVSGIEMVGRFVSSKVKRDDVTAVVGISSDKEAEKVLERISRFASRVILTKSSNPRALDPVEMSKVTLENTRVSINEEPLSALKEAVDKTGDNGLVIVTGSLFLVGDILKTL